MNFIDAGSFSFIADTIKLFDICPQDNRTKVSGRKCGIAAAVESLFFSEGFVNRLRAVLNVQLLVYFMNVLSYRTDRNAELIGDLFI